MQTQENTKWISNLILIKIQFGKNYKCIHINLKVEQKAPFQLSKRLNSD